MISFAIPIHAQSTANLRESWQVRHRRTAKQKRDTRLLCPPWTLGPLLVVKLTRVGPRALDGDNLQAALKSCRDAIATWLRVDDASPLVRWEYAQEKGESSVQVEVKRVVAL